MALAAVPQRGTSGRGHGRALGRARADNFSWQKTAEQTLKVYQEVLDEK